MTGFGIVEVDSVFSSVPRSKFKENDLDFLADRILETGGLLKPLILKKIGFEKYEVLDGHCVYYAAVRAREKNPHKGEIVNAFIIASDKEDVAVNQVAALTTLASPEKTDMGELLQQIIRLDAKLNQVLSNNTDNKAKSNHSDNEERLKYIESRLDNLSTALETLTVLLKELLPPPKLNLVTANEEQVKNALEEAGVKNPKYRNAAWEAITYWKQPGKTLTWENLQSSVSSREHNINDFGKATYKNLKEIACIRLEN
ncbi:hypothetical protein [Anabaena sp. 4-3]|uniref:hypothetical protein n=1 Tax=Anabaena sp. 4-3 TaxID=1811979 RepID=UPI00082F7DE5|nr:hypothetical protein [Anabaena sp. 4-3]